MDLNNAERAARKLLQYVNSVASSDNRLYSKSKDRLKTIADICLQVVDVASQILQSELLEFEDGEFDENIDQDTVDAIEAVNQRTKELRNFVKADSHTNKVLKIPNTEVKIIVSNYRSIVFDLQKVDCQQEVVRRCIKIIVDWMENRLFTTYNNAPPFKYNVYRIKNIIYSIVLAYGKAVEEDTVDEFEEMFSTWFSQLGTDSSSNTWIAPYPIYSIERKIASKSLESEDVNLTAVLIFELLWDAKLDKFSRLTDNYNVYIKLRDFWNLISSTDSTKLDDYEPYLESDILSRYKIV